MLSENDIHGQFQKVLGRQATPTELADYKRFSGTGYVDLSAEDVGRALQGMPEYQQKQLSQYGGQYEQQLAQGDQRMLGLAQNSLTQQFAQQGRTISSSAYINAFAQTSKDLAMQRQNTLANFYGQGYQNIMGNSQQQGQDALGMGFNSLAQAKNQQFSRENYGLQQNAFNDYLNQQNRQNRQQMFGGALGGLVGAGAGALAGSFGGPGGALAGARLGGSIGGNFGQGLRF